MHKWLWAIMLAGTVLAGCIGFVDDGGGRGRGHHYHHHDWR